VSIKLQRMGDGHYRLRGELDYESVPVVWRVGLDTFAADEAIEIDLERVSRSNSAGLALLIEWQREVKKAGKTITYTNMPAQMLAIARASSLDQILPLARS
jgi:phospholipid transport system transporter-binding protein